MRKNTGKWRRPLQVLSGVCTLFLLSPAHAQLDISVVAVYGAQSHVVNLDDQNYDALNNEGVKVRRPFPMLADRDMLFKVNLIGVPGFSENNDLPEESDLDVTVRLTLNDETTTITLDPPAIDGLPTFFDTNPADLVHTFDDSFTTNITKKWMKPGLKWQISWCLTEQGHVVCHDEEERTLLVRPPIKMLINAFPFEHFGWNWRSKSVDIDSMFEEMAQKLPVSELIVQKPETDYYQVLERLIPGQGGTAPNKKKGIVEKIGSPPRIIDSVVKDGLHWGTQVVDSTAWNQALYQAAGIDFNRYTASYMLMGANQKTSKGVGATNAMTSTVMNRGANYGVAWHESLHMYGLLHYGEVVKGRPPIGTGDYPYLGEYDGLPPLNNANSGHIGPSWAYDSRFKIFLSPIRTRQDSGHTHWRTAPDKKGNEDAHWDVYGMFSCCLRMTPLSDWSASRVMDRWGGRPAWFDATKDSYWVDKSGWHRWDEAQNKFVPATISESKKGFWAPKAGWGTKRVYSLLMQASTATEFYNVKGGFKVKDIEPLAIVYPPIGPYKTYVQWQIDPTREGNRNWGLSRGMCDEVSSFCDFSVRVKRKGIWKTYVLDRTADWNADTPAWGRGIYSNESFVTVAINLEVKDGEVEEAQFLHTPNVLQNPWPDAPTVLATWQK